MEAKFVSLKFCKRRPAFERCGEKSRRVSSDNAELGRYIVPSRPAERATSLRLTSPSSRPNGATIRKVGDHDIILGEVLSGEDIARSPPVFHKGAYGVFNAAVALVEAERFLRQTTREKETDRDSNLDLLADVSIPLAHLR